MKKFALTQILFVMAIWSQAQNTEQPRVIISETAPASKAAQNTLIDKFAQFDKAVIKTGFLVDKVSDSSSFASLTKAQSKERAGSTGDWISTYHTLKSAEVSGSNVMKRDQLYAAIDKLYSEKTHDSIPLGVIAIRYESLKSDAIKSKKIQYDSLKPIKILNATNLTEEHLKIGIAPLQEYLGTSGAVTFYFPGDYTFTNIELSRYPLSIDFDDGKGFQLLDFNKGYTVDYQTNGPKEIVVKSNSETQLAKNTSLSTSGITSSSTLMVTTSIPDPTTVSFSVNMPTSYPFGGGTVAADLYEYYSGVLDNPIIVIDGFDPGNERDWWETNDSPEPGLYELLNQNDFLEDARTLGYDFIVIDNIAGADYIERNAYLLTTVIDKVNAEKTGDNELIIVGPSMGGLISRIALKWMEDQNRDHHTRLWVSFDSPHKGANVPLGIQWWIHFFADQGNAKVQDVLTKLRSPAGKQILLYHESAGTSAVLSERTNFNAFLNNLSYPSDLRKVAISNGAGNGSGILDNDFNPINSGDRIVTWDYDNWLTVDILGNAWSLPPSGTTSKIFHGRVDKTWVGNLFSWDFQDEELEVSFVGNGNAYDIAPGGHKDIAYDIADGDTEGNGDITTTTDDVSHIPMFSSLVLSNGLFYNVQANHAVAKAASPFDELYYSITGNEEHIHISNKTHEDFFREVIPKRAIVNDGWDEGSIVATESIYVEPGFKSKPGVPLKMEVIPNALNPIGL